MARGSCTFKQIDVTRAVKGARAAGVDVARIKIGKDGTIQIETGKPTDEPDKPEINEWDVVS